MKKTYIAPSVEIENVEAFQMIAESIGYGGSGFSGDADTKEEGDWNIWDSEAE